MSTWPDGGGVVRMPDGRRFRGSGLRAPRRGVPEPEFSLTLQARDPGTGGWPARWVRWRDFGLPVDRADALDAVREAHERSLTERVEVACSGGVGRTGTVLALLAIRSGVDPQEAVAWVRAHYLARAVETGRQRRWVLIAGESLRPGGGDDPRE